METTQLAHIDLKEIELSDTNKMFRDEPEMQPAALQDLINSIKEKGVISPIMLRPGKKKKYELVCGERRYRASLAAKLDTIPANIRKLTDEEALECQITENLQRNDVNPMKEAHAFEWMHVKKKYTTQQIATKIGKSIDYVQERMRLNSLSHEGQDLVRSGILPIKAALKITRVPKDLQASAIIQCTEMVDGASGKNRIFTGMNRLENFLNYNVYNDLKSADFDLEDTKLNPSAGACSTCPKRTKNAAGLFGDVSKADSCLDRECWKKKAVANYKNIADQVRKKFPGIEVVFRDRNYSVRTDDLRKDLHAQILPCHSGGQPASEKEAKTNKKIKVAVLVGTSKHSSENNGKEYIFLKPEPQSKRISNPTSYSTPKKSSADLQREKERKIREGYERVSSDILIAESMQKKTSAITMDAILRYAIKNELDMGDNETILPALRVLGIDCEIKVNSKKQLVRAKGDDLYNIDQSQFIIVDDAVIDKITAKLDTKKLNFLLSWVSYANARKPSDLVKLFKIDTQVIKRKAVSQTVSWWKQRQDAMKFVADGKKKAGLSALLTKKKK